MRLIATITISDSQAVLAILHGVGTSVRQRDVLHQAIADDAAGLTQAYLHRLSQTRHASAQRLQARPTGHWAKASRGVRGVGTPTAATLILANAPGISRAFKDVTIRPTGGRKYLTIPIHHRAYGRTAKQFKAEVGDLFPLNTGKGNTRAKILATKQEGSKFATAVYLLVPSVYQKQDRSLLPSDEAYTRIATRAIANALPA